MRRYLMLAVAAAALFSMNAMAATSGAAPKSLSTVRCRDAKGHFITCAKKVAPQHCRDAKGKFVACSK
ncbi:hypothetical protein [Lysobacter tyrosinilyticus]